MGNPDGEVKEVRSLKFFASMLIVVTLLAPAGAFADRGRSWHGRSSSSSRGHDHCDDDRGHSSWRGSNPDYNGWRPGSTTSGGHSHWHSGGTRLSLGFSFGSPAYCAPPVVIAPIVPRHVCVVERTWTTEACGDYYPPEYVGCDAYGRRLYSRGYTVVYVTTWKRKCCGEAYRCGTQAYKRYD